jgi:hypothetical protein
LVAASHKGLDSFDFGVRLAPLNVKASTMNDGGLAVSVEVVITCVAHDCICSFLRIGQDGLSLIAMVM